MVSAPTGSSLHFSNAGGVAKEIDHVLLDGSWRMIQNRRVYRSAQFPNTDHRLVAATLTLQHKSRRTVQSQPMLDVSKLKDERGAEEFVNRLSGDLWGLGALGDPEELWNAFKTTILDVAGGCLGTHLASVLASQFMKDLSNFFAHPGHQPRKSVGIIVGVKKRKKFANEGDAS